MLLCLSEVLLCLRRLERASCTLPVNCLEHDLHITTEVIRVLESDDVGEMEASIVVVGEVAELSASADCEMPVYVQDIALFGEDSRVSAPLLVEDTAVGESRTCCCPLFPASAPASGPCLAADSLDFCMSASPKIFCIPSKSSR